MIEMAQRRNRGQAFNARFIATTVEDAEFGDDAYDKAFAVHVAALEKPGPALDKVRGRLAPGGRLYLFSQAPGWRTAGPAEAFGAELGARLAAAGFEIDERLVGDLGSAFASGVVASVR